MTKKDKYKTPGLHELFKEINCSFYTRFVNCCIQKLEKLKCFPVIFCNSTLFNPIPAKVLENQDTLGGGGQNL